MNGDIDIRVTGQAGRITLNRPDALNALTHDMCLAIQAALDTWANDVNVALVVIDATGDRAFCAGGDIAEMYRTASAGDYEYGRTYWRDEYRLNAKIFNFPKPYVSFMQGYTMGGGVGVSCHGSHRIVCENSQIAMPECGIGLVPDVGGSLLLSRAPGRLGEYLGTTGMRMGPGDAILAEFADYYVPQAHWKALITALEISGNLNMIDQAALPPPQSPLQAMQSDIDRHFSGETMGDIARSLAHEPGDFSAAALNTLNQHSPLSLACTIEMIHRIRGNDNITWALDLEYRFTHRAAQYGDFIEGIRAAVIDRDHAPRWQHPTISDVRPIEISKMLMPLKENTLKL
ncbi:MAG: enoyl-CoA hydratase/isomerase family protein [Paracoccaceae bacterium]